MKRKIILILVLLLVIVSSAIPSVPDYLCVHFGYDKALVKNDALFCEIRQTQPDGTIMTATIKLSSILESPEVMKNFWRSFDEIPTKSF